MAWSAKSPVCRDAVIVVPGIMGSELVDDATGTLLWGLRDPLWYVRAWTSGSPLRALRLTDDERVGEYGRVRATRLVRFPAWAPMVQGIEPYTRLLDGIRQVVVHEAAIMEFAYDWRLPVSFNGSLLAEAMQRHLTEWRQHPAQVAARQDDVNQDEPKVVIVAHSMGGLVAQHMALVPGAVEAVRAVATLGTPFYGAVKAALMLNSGSGFPIPISRARLQNLAIGLPGIYDLLPMQRCIDNGTEARSLTANDIAGIGGDAQLADESIRRHQSRAGAELPGHVRVVGAHQPTLQSLTIQGSVAIGHSYSCRPARNGIIRVDLAGDGTVPRDSAETGSGAATPLAQTHGALAKTNEAILVITDMLTRRETGPWLGAGEIGLEVPDVVTISSPFDVLVSGIDHPRDANCRVIDANTGRQVGAPPLRRSAGQIVAQPRIESPGLYRIEVAGGGVSPVSQMVLVSENPDGTNTNSADVYAAT
jgi:pimeloyl-ACP methyl ester carboxylesterase